MGESKIIIVANQKGGAGKSTLCMLLANYLQKLFGVDVGAIIDTDLQKSIVKKRETDLEKFEGAVAAPYQVVSFLLSNQKQIPAFIRQLRSTSRTYIIDTPGTLAYEGLFTFLVLADYLLCPFDYDVMTLDATTVFLRSFEKFKTRIYEESGMNIKTKVILVPSRRPPNKGTKKEKELWEKIKINYSKLYDITPEIPNLSSISRADTMSITPEQIKKSEDTLSFIANIIYNPNKENKNDQNDE